MTRRSQELNVAAHLMKPAKQAEMLNALLIAQGSQSAPTATVAANASRLPTRPLRVLLVEDGLANQKLAVGMLNRWGHTVTVAENGAVALKMYQADKFDLVFMDLQMPVMDGLEATRRIRETEAGTENHVPIIAMTAHALVGDRERCIEAGMDDYVSKPIRTKDLASALAMFNRPEQVNDIDEDSDSPASDASPATGINLDQALETMENDRAILISVIQAFLTEAPSLLQQFDDAVATGNQEVAPPICSYLEKQLRYSAAASRTRDLATFRNVGKRTTNLTNYLNRRHRLTKCRKRAFEQLTAFLEGAG